MDALFLNHYERELAYLRELGGEFADQYPKIAGRLGMDKFSCADPSVERLLEGFAFMAARIQRRLDSEFPQLTRGLLDTVFPHYTRPLPSAAMFQLVPDFDSSSLASGYTIPKGTRLYAQAAPGQSVACRFDTTSDTTLWPVRIAEAEFFTRDRAVGYPLPKEFRQQGMRTGLRLTLESLGGLKFNQLQLDDLQLYLQGGEVAQQLYETIVCHTKLFSAGDSRGWTTLPESLVTPHGFDYEDSLLPQVPRSFSGYRLLQEYFMLPEKFLFVNLNGLRSHFQQLDSNECRIVLGFDSHEQSLSGRVSQEHLSMHVVPAVNLFQQRADRVHINHQQGEQHLIVDRSRPLDFEIWSIEEMHGHSTNRKGDVPFLPLYSPPAFDSDRQRHATYFTHERRTRLESSYAKQRRSFYPGTELFVSLTDSHQEPFRHQVQQLSATVYCTNRDLPLLPPEHGWREAFHAESAAPIQQVLCIGGPTQPGAPLVGEDGDTAWRLISHLTPNYLSLQDNASGGAAMLRELLSLYCAPYDHSARRQIEGILSIQSRQVVRRLPFPGPVTHGHGVSINLDCDEDAFEGRGVFLLGSVLEQFFSRYATINSFTETSLSTVKRGHVCRWPVRLGDAPML
ncbi:MAG: type VI secretion system baseplate subunit TssF [Planctomycetota bacterium]